MNDNVLIRSEEPAADARPVSKLYPLDWETTEVKLAGGRFSHVLRRPTAEQLLKRDEDLQQQIPVGRDGSYSLPDPTATDAVDAALYDEIVVEAKGYPGEVPELHKAKAFQALYNREFEIPEGEDIFADEIAVADEIGTGVEPDFTVRHVFRQPTQSELNSYRRKMNAKDEVKPGKRGRQIVVTRSNLRTAVQFYDLWVQRVEGASVEGQPWSQDDHTAFIAAVDPLVKRKAVGVLVSKLTDGLSD